MEFEFHWLHYSIHRQKLLDFHVVKLSTSIWIRSTNSLIEWRKKIYRFNLKKCEFVTQRLFRLHRTIEIHSNVFPYPYIKCIICFIVEQKEKETHTMARHSMIHILRVSEWQLAELFYLWWFHMLMYTIVLAIEKWRLRAMNKYFA